MRVSLSTCWTSVADRIVPLTHISAFMFAVALTQTAVFAQGPGSTKPTVGLRDLKPQIVALEHVDVVVRPGERIEDVTLLIRDGAIVGLGKSVEIPVGAETLNRSGHVVYAGFIDAYSEVTVPDPSNEAGAPYWNGNVLPQRSTSDVAAGSLLDAKKLRSQGVTMRLLAPEGGIVKGSSCLVLCDDGDSNQILVRDKVWHHLSLTVPRRRGGGRDSYPNSPMGAMALLRQSLLDARWYDEAHRAYASNRQLTRPETDIALDELAGAMIHDTFVLDAPNERMALRGAGIANEFSLKSILRGSGREYRDLEAIAQTGMAILLPVDFPDAPKVVDAVTAREASLVELLEWELSPSNPAKLAEAGVEFCLTTDGLDDPATFLKQVRQAVTAGLNTDKALAAITTTPAKLLGVEDLVGTVEPGRMANIVVLDGDLFDEKTKTIETWVAGKRYEVTAQDESPIDNIVSKWDVTVAGISAEAGTQEWTLELSRKDKELKGTLVSKNAVVTPEAAATETPSAGETTEKPESEEVKEEEVKEEVKEEEISESEVTEDKVKQDEVTEDEIKSEEVKSEEVKSEEPKKGEVKKAELTKLERSRDQLKARVDLSKVDAGLPKGVSFIEWVTVGTDELAEVASSTITLPDGRVLSMSVTRVAAENDAEVAKTEADAAKKDDVTKEGDSKEEKGSKAEAEKLVIEVMRPLGAYGLTAPPVAKDFVMFRGATVWTSGPEGIIEGGDVLVKGGKIDQVGKGLAIPEGCEVIDVTGKHISPGLIDCHSHMATDGGVNESGETITAEVRIGDFIDNTDISIYRQLAGGLTSANILHGSANPIGGQNQVIKLRWGASMEEMRFAGAPKGIKFALGENVKRTRGRYPDTRMGVEQIIRDQFLAAKEYAAAHRAYRDGNRKGLPPRIDLQLAALAEILEGARWVHCHSYRQDEIVALLDVLDEFGVKIGSLQHILEGYKVADRIKAHGGTASSFSDWWAYKFEVYDAIPYNGAIMHNQGIVVSFNSDDAELARHMNTEAGKGVKYGGVSPEEALKFVTLNPAKQLRIDDRVGSIEVGKDADLVIWSGSPLSTLTRCEQTWVDGRCYFSLEKDAELRARDAKLHASLVQKAIDQGAGTGGARRPRIAEEDRWHRHDIFCGHSGHGHEHDGLESGDFENELQHAEEASE